MPKWLSQLVQAGLPINSFNTAAATAESFPYEEQVGNSLVVREPVGVVGAITPWNYPLHQIAAKVAYAMAAGCTVVLKPSEVAPLDAYILAEVIDDVGLPAGVFNLVSGTGQVVGNAISSHPLIDMVSFTGSTPRRVPGRRQRRRVDQAGRPRAGRQVGQHPPRRPRRRRLREGRPRRRRQGLPELGPDLHRADPDAGAPRSPRRRRAHRRRRGRGQVPADRPVRPGRPPRPALQPGPGRARQRLHPEGHRRGRQARHRRHRRARRARVSRAASTSSRPCSPRSPTT